MVARPASAPRPSLPAGADWAAHELARAPLPDARLVQRLITVATDFAQQPTPPLPQACGTWAKTKAAYRFFDNHAVEPLVLLAAHVQATAARPPARRRPPAPDAGRP